MAPACAVDLLDDPSVVDVRAARVPGPLPGPAAEPLPEHDTEPEPIEPEHEHEHDDEDGRREASALPRSPLA